MRIATYNVNGVNARLPRLLEWLEETQPDVVCLQELKSESFPVRSLNDAGYGAIWHGQKSWHGVAILARDAEPIETRRDLPGDVRGADARYLEAAVKGVLVGCLYAPNGNPIGGAKYAAKLAWHDRFAAHAAGLLASGHPVVLAGDYNIIPTDADAATPRLWRDNALFQPEAKARYAALVKTGWTDALRALNPDERVYTFWKTWDEGLREGLRLDHLLLSPSLAPRLTAAGVDRDHRALTGASDHAAAWVDLAPPPSA